MESVTYALSVRVRIPSPTDGTTLLYTFSSRQDRVNLAWYFCGITSGYTKLANHEKNAQNAQSLTATCGSMNRPGPVFVRRACPFEGRAVEGADGGVSRNRRRVCGTREEPCACHSAIFVAPVEAGLSRQLTLPVEAGSPRLLTASGMAVPANPLQSAVATNAPVTPLECAVTKQRT